MHAFALTLYPALFFAAFIVAMLWDSKPWPMQEALVPVDTPNSR